VVFRNEKIGQKLPLGKTARDRKNVNDQDEDENRLFVKIAKLAKDDGSLHVVKPTLF